MKYSYSKIENLCSQIQEIGSDIRKNFDSIQNSINTINSSWTGDAADYYVKQIKKLSFNFEEFTRELNASVLFLEKSSEEYSKLDKNIQNEITEKLKMSKFFY